MRKIDALFPGLAIVVLAVLVTSFITIFDKHSCEIPSRIVCRSNLNGLGKSAVLYACDYNWHPAPDLSFFVKEDLISPRMFVCPSTGIEPTKSHDIEDILKHCDYIYAPISPDIEQGDTLLAFELPANHRQEAVNVLHISHNETIRHKDMDDFRRKVQNLNDLMARLRRESE